MTLMTRTHRLAAALAVATMVLSATASAQPTTVTIQGDVVINEVVAAHTDRIVRWPDPRPDQPERFVPGRVGMDPAWFEGGFDASDWRAAWSRQVKKRPGASSFARASFARFR